MSRIEERGSSPVRALNAVFVLLLILISTPSYGADVYRAGYELTLQVGETEWQIQTRSTLTTAEPITHQLGDYVVSISLDDTSDVTYKLIVAVRESGAWKMQDDLLSQAFEGSFNGILEFASNADNLSLEGAIAINRLKP